MNKIHQNPKILNGNTRIQTINKSSTLRNVSKINKQLEIDLQYVIGIKSVIKLENKQENRTYLAV